MKLWNRIRSILRNTWRFLRLGVLLTLVMFFFAGSTVNASGFKSRTYAYTRQIEFDYGTWTLDAIWEKLASWGLSFTHFLPPETQSQLVLDYLNQVKRVSNLQTNLVLIYADPNIEDPHSASKTTQLQLDREQRHLRALAPFAESILQSQLMTVVNETGIGDLGQVVPPSLYQFSDTPLSLVISPRDKIAQILEISLLPVMNAEEKDSLENRILDNLNLSALVVPIGGVGTYPTMVMQTTDIVWLTEVISHEWVHNYLTLHPLGINYYTNDQLRTINETTASLAGKELGKMILKKYYPDYMPAEKMSVQGKAASHPNMDENQNIFDFRAEMRKTRVNVDRLLAEGKVKEAEDYMKARRQLFWDNGYLIRKLNQAYFAFYGAYNDEPGGGAAGIDPVGPAVQAFRDKFANVGDFLKAISWLDSYDDLLRELKG